MKRRSNDPVLGHSMTAFAEAVARAFECEHDGKPSPKLLKYLGIKDVVFCAESPEELSIFNAKVRRAAAVNYALESDIHGRMGESSFYRVKLDGYDEAVIPLHAVREVELHDGGHASVVEEKVHSQGEVGSSVVTQSVTEEQSSLCSSLSSKEASSSKNDREGEVVTVLSNTEAEQSQKPAVDPTVDK